MKKIFILLLAICSVGTMFGQTTAQGIASITIEGTLSPVSKRNPKDVPGEIQAVVAPGFDMENVIINCNLASGYSLVGGEDAIPKDFSTENPQTIQVTDGTVVSNWVITIKKINPATLPFSQTFSSSNQVTSWNTSTIGWAAAGIDATGYPNVVRFGSAPISFVVAFNSAPSTVSYKLNSVTGDFKAGKFVVEASKDGISWATLRIFDIDGSLTTTPQDFSDNLDATDRYVRWIYESRPSSGAVNVNLNNIAVSKNEGAGATLVAPARAGSGMQSFTVKNALHMYSNPTSNLGLIAPVTPDFDYTDPTAAVFEMSSGTTLKSPDTMPKDFSSPQTIIVTRNSVDYTWPISVPKINLAELPLNLTFSSDDPAIWDSSTSGWVPFGLKTTGGRSNVMAFDANQVGVVLGFEGEAVKLTYDLYINNVAPVTLPADAVFDILTTDINAKTWTPLYTYNSTNQIPASDAPSITKSLDLDANVSYVKFVYTNRGATDGQNLNLNNIKITKTATSTITPESSPSVIFYQPAAGEIIFSQPAVKAEVFNMIGALDAVYNNPGTTLTIADGSKGIVIVRVTLGDGTVVSQKAVK